VPSERCCPRQTAGSYYSGNEGQEKASARPYSATGALQLVLQHAEMDAKHNTRVSYTDKDTMATRHVHADKTTRPTRWHVILHTKAQPNMLSKWELPPGPGGMMSGCTPRPPGPGPRRKSSGLKPCVTKHCHHAVSFHGQSCLIISLTAGCLGHAALLFLQASLPGERA